MFTRILPVLLLALTIAGCGGGGGGGSGGSGGTGNNPPPPPPAASSQDISQAGDAALAAALDAGTNAVTLSWKDTITGTKTYTVQRLDANGTWTDVTTVTGSNGSGSTLTWSGPAGSATAFRVLASFTGYTVPLTTTSRQDQVKIVTLTTPPTVNLSATEPLNGPITATIGGGGTFTRVEYYVDLALVGTSTSGPTYPVNFVAGGTAPSTHLLLVRLYTSADTAVEVRRTLQYSGTVPVFTFHGASEVQGPDLVIKASLVANATGNVTITAFVDNVAISTLTATNYVGIGGPGYRWTKPASSLVSGPHVVRIDATDGSGAQATWSLTVPVNNLPVLTLTSPFDGMLVNGTLHIDGTASTDRPGATTSLKVTLGDSNLNIFNSAASTFNGTFDLTGLAPGAYPFTAKLTDSVGYSVTQTGVITVTSSPSLVYTPLMKMGSGATLLAVGTNRTALVQKPDDTFHLVTGSGDVVLDTQGIFTVNLKDWKVENGNVFAVGQIDDNVSTGFYLFQWAPNGTRTTRGSVTTQRIYAAHWPWVLVDGTPLQFVNAMSGTTVTTSATASGGPNEDADFYLAGGTELIAYYEQTREIYRWNQSNDQVTLVASTPTFDLTSPITDGTSVVWRSNPIATSGPFTLRKLDIGSSTQTNVSTTATLFNLQNGLLTWAEQTGAQPPYVLKLSDGNTTTNLGWVDYTGMGNGFVLVATNGKVYATGMSGTLRVLVDSFPDYRLAAGNTAFFVLGSSKVLYAIANP